MPNPRFDLAATLSTSGVDRAGLQRPISAVPPSSEAERLLLTLGAWHEAGALRALDLALTRFLAQQADEQDGAVLLAVALTSERNGHGHVCFDLQDALAHPEALLARLRDDQEISPPVRQALRTELQALTLADWMVRLAASTLVSNRLGVGVGSSPEVSPEPSSGSDSRPTSETGAERRPSAGIERATDEAATPLVLAGTRQQPLLYLRRYWHYEERIRGGIETRLQRRIPVDPAALRRQLDALFQRSAHGSLDQPSAQFELDLGPELNWQRIACALAAQRAFFVITGGPGTGKTTTVVRLLAVLQGLAAAAQEPPLRIELAAPTGKAAARLNESITEQVRGLPVDLANEGRIPTQVKTLHRLLGTRPDSRHFRHHAANPLPADVVVVDEASMVDVEMMASLLDAMRADTRLILLGDKDQLSSVEAGAVLGDLCQRAVHAHYWPETIAWLEQAAGERLPHAYCDAAGNPLDQAVAMLRKSYRFIEQGGIGALAALVNQPLPGTNGPGPGPGPGPGHGQGQGQQGRRLGAALQLFEREQQRPASELGAIEALQLAAADAPALSALTLAGYGGPGGYLRRMREQSPAAEADQCQIDGWAKQVLEAQKQFQLLTPLRQGDWGVEGLNQRIIETLRAAGHLDVEPVALGVSQRQWFAGRPVLVTRNDYALNLMNGDVGVTLRVPVGTTGAAQWMLRVAFPSADGGVRWVLPSRLQAVETVFAMTVHKSQGSEFSHTALILPDSPNPVLTRELLYTAITRAKARFTLLYSDAAVLGQALERQVQRVSGLKQIGAR